MAEGKEARVKVQFDDGWMSDGTVFYDDRGP
jgi:hypothetical protein